MNAQHYPAVIAAAGPAARAGWNAFLDNQDFRPSTRAVYRSSALRFLRWLEPQGLSLEKITAREVERFLDELQAAASTISMYRTGLRRFFDALLACQAVSANPADQAGCGTTRAIPTPTETDEPPPTLEEMKAAIRALDPAAIDNDPEMLDAGVVLLAGMHLGTRKIMPISRFTGVTPWQVATFAQRLRDNGVWTPDGKTAGEWDDEGMCIELLINILVATGMAERRAADTPWPQEQALAPGQG